MGLFQYLLRAAKCVLFALLLCSCTAAGFQEFQLYSQAYNAQYVQGEAVLTALGRAERVLFTRRLARTADAQYFQPNDAAFYVDGVDPPTTASIRTSLTVIKDYNDAMVALGNGESAKALTNRISTLTSNALGAVSATASAMNAPQIVLGTQSLAASLNFLLKDLPFVNAALTAASREAFRKQLIASFPVVEAMLIRVRNEGTPIMYLVLRQARRTRGSELPTGLTPEAQSGVEQDRKMLAGWVLLLDKTLVSLRAAKAAAENGSPINLTNLSNAAIELRMMAEQVKNSQSQ
ncbi:hypothetical protein HFO38_15635 [Rhizobium leguminosarum]|uniref:hypothetical protein n=1 Tax=Rhizobium leguminosarum TaxID=384 RepID=UPI001C94F203|nr:hypothetical protein [Rhizobium leguminosarum]MBY5704140.1 hypothetical protein [Rhizobium leguminosarum]